MANGALHLERGDRGAADSPGGAAASAHTRDTGRCVAMRKLRGREDAEDGPSSSGPPSIGQQVAHIQNKQVRSIKYQELKRKDGKRRKGERKKRQEATSKALEMGVAPPTRQEPKTIESTREKDETVVQPDDEEVAMDEDDDEFAGEGRSECREWRGGAAASEAVGSTPCSARDECEGWSREEGGSCRVGDAPTPRLWPLTPCAAHFKRERPPNVLITTCYKPTGIMYRFISELLEVLPNAVYYKRAGYALKKIVQYAKNRDFTDLIVVNQDRKQINAMLVVHLPDGPTALFRLSKLKLAADIKVWWVVVGDGRPPRPVWVVLRGCLSGSPGGGSSWLRLVHVLILPTACPFRRATATQRPTARSWC